MTSCIHFHPGENKNLGTCSGGRFRDGAVIGEAYCRRGGCQLRQEGEPSLVTLAGRAVKATAEWVAKGAKQITDEQYAERLAICQSCEPYWDPEGWAGLGKCTHPACGCSKIKLKMNTQKCPINKWGKIE